MSKIIRLSEFQYEIPIFTINKDFDGFFETHPNSPISILFLKVLSKYSSFGLPLYSLEKQKLSFAKLSDRLKNSDEGKELSKKLQ